MIYTNIQYWIYQSVMIWRKTKAKISNVEDGGRCYNKPNDGSFWTEESGSDRGKDGEKETDRQHRKRKKRRWKLWETENLEKEWKEKKTFSTSSSCYIVNPLTPPNFSENINM